MEPESAPARRVEPDALEFVRFCYRRRHVGWPELYDEMCAVAGRGLFRGYDADDLAGIGIGFSLFEMASLAALARQVAAEEQALRRPVAVTIHAATDGDGAADRPISASERRSNEEAATRAGHVSAVA